MTPSQHDAATRSRRRIDVSANLWIGVFFYLLLARAGLDFLITGNRHLGPIEYGVADPTRPHGSSSYIAGAFSVAFFGAVTLGIVIYTRFWRQWLFWKGAPERTAVEVVVGTLFAFLALTEIFAAPTTLLLAHHTLSTTHPVKPPSELYLKTEALYVWHFADSIPALEVPKTLRWTVPYEFTNAAGGSLILLYKILVIAPVVTLALDLVGRARRS